MTAASWDDELRRQDAAKPDFIRGRLRQEFVMPPFSVLDTMDGEWQARRRYWLALGIQSELGRGGATRSNPTSGMASEVHRPEMRGVPVQVGGNVKVRVATRGQARSFGVDLMRGESADRYDYSGPNSRRAADQRSNLTGAAPLPDYVTNGGGAGLENTAPGTSIFDPVLAELCYRWFCPPGGTVLDPFAGGSVRGIVASVLGHPYTGVDLSARQIAANREQAAAIVRDGLPMPRWYVGDSAQVLPDLPAGDEYDMVMTCPPYYDLEVYGDDEGDISAMSTLADFADAYSRILAAAVHRLREGRFAVVVMGEARYTTGPRQGHLYGLVPITIAAMEQAGAAYYNDAILVNARGSLPVRSFKQFTARTNGRKLGRHHQYVLVFLKGKADTGAWDYSRDDPPQDQLTMGLASTPDVLTMDVPMVDLAVLPDPVATVDVPSYEDQRSWSDDHMPEQLAIVAHVLGTTPDRVSVTGKGADVLLGVDAVTNAPGGRAQVALRVRKRTHPDWTLRVDLATGRDTELPKYRDSATVTHSLLAWTDGPALSEWVMVDLQVLRDSGFLAAVPDRYPIIPNRDRRTAFRAVPLADLRAAGAIMATGTWPLAPKQAPQPPTPAQGARPIYIRCQRCGGTLLMVNSRRTCEDCGWSPEAQA